MKNVGILLVLALQCEACRPEPMEVSSDAGSQTTPTPVVSKPHELLTRTVPHLTPSPPDPRTDVEIGIAACTASDSSWRCAMAKPKVFAATGAPPLTPVSWTVPTWYVDPANTSRRASDSNSCSTSAAPCLTSSQILSRWGTPSPTLPQATTFVQMSSDTAPFPSAWALSPQSIYSMVFEGQLSMMRIGTVGTYTALNRTAGTKGTLTLSGVGADAGSFWTPYVGTFIEDTTSGAYFWIDADLGGGVATITTPLEATDPFTFFISTSVPAYGTITPGDALVFYTMPTAWCRSMPLSTQAFAIVYHLRCTDPPLPGLIPLSPDYIPLTIESRVDSSVHWSDCTNTGTTFTNNERNFFVNSFFDSFVSAEGQWIGGAITSVDSTLGCGVAPVVLDGDVLVDNRQHLAFNQVLEIYLAFLGGVGSIHTYTSFGTVTLGGWNYNGDYGTAAVWGTEPIDVSDGEVFVCEENCTKQLLVTGGMTMEQSLTTAYPWLADAGTWGSTLLSLTPANVDTYGAMCRPPLRDCFYSHQLP